MIGQLNNTQMDRLLSSQLIGRIGYGTGDRHYILPVTYVFHNGAIYIHSKEGVKLKTLRQNPTVCFQVDDIVAMNNWRSVLVWGKYEELKREDEQVAALEILRDRFGPYTLSESVLPDVRGEHHFVQRALRAVAYRINVVEKSGRYEKP